MGKSLGSRLISFLLLLASSCCATLFAEPMESLQGRPDPVGTPTQIHVTTYIVDVREIDGARQSFSGDVFIRLRWKDPRLAMGNGLRVLPTNAAWNPAVQIVNRITVQTTLPEVLEVDSQGNVLYRQRFIGQFSCIMDLREFPFDRQAIPIRIVAAGLSPSEVQFVKDESGLASRLALTDWKVTSWQAKPEPYQVGLGARSLAGYRFEFNVERHFYFFLVQIVIPMTLILGMSWIAFWLDVNQPGPRISISITSMLTIVAYRLLLGNSLPRLPFLTRMDYFVFKSTFLVFLSLVNVVFISRLMFAKKELLANKFDMHSRWIFPALFVLVIVTSFVL